MAFKTFALIRNLLTKFFDAVFQMSYLFSKNYKLDMHNFIPAIRKDSF